MKQFYRIRHIMAFLSIFCCFTASFAQGTSPASQNLPYVQDFSTLISTSTTYPPGFQGWKTATAPSSLYPTTGVLLGDQALTANSTAATTSGNVHNYSSKIGFLTTGSLDIAIGLAINTSGKSGIEVQYNAMTIRNPYSVLPATTNTRINEMTLQYRVGTTADFITLPATAYQNNTTPQSSGTTPQNTQLIKVALPSICNNEPVVQIRWISRQVSGGGSRPSFAIDDISITNDTTPPIDETGYPKTGSITSESVDFYSKINENGKTYFVLLASGSTKPSPAQIKSGLDSSGNPVLQSGVLNIADKSQEYLTNIAGLTLGTSYTICSISEDLNGNIQAAGNKLDFTTSSIPVPKLTLSSTALDLGFSESNFDSKSLSYQFRATNLSNPVNLVASANFTLSKEPTVNFQSSLTFDATEFDTNNNATVYVRFTPNATATFSGEITHQSTGATSKTITLSGIGINPYTQNFNDPNVLTNSGWTAYSVTGDIIKWASQTTRFNSSPAAMLINGYAETGASKDWLISPNLRLDNFTAFPLLSFYSRKFYAGTDLKLMVSTDYDGFSNPETATWTALEGDFPTTTGTFKQSKYINLEAYKTSHTYLAWVYETPTNAGNNSSEWTLDDVSITNETEFLSSNPNLTFEEVSPDNFSISQAFVFLAGGYDDITLTAPAHFQLSLDNVSFQSSIAISQADAVIGKTLFARFAPTVKALNLNGKITVVGTGLNQEIGFLTASSWPKTETYDVVNYNLEFFGSNVIGSTGTEFGPIDDALQVENVAKVMNKLDADVYVVQEVSDEPSLESLIQKISINGKTFGKVISPAWSYSFTPPDPQFPPQKLVIIYNTKTTTVKKTRVMFQGLYDKIRSGEATLTDYPGGNSSSFFASGRLPYMVTVETNLNGVKKELNLIDLHGRANSGTDISKYNMRKYDAEFLKDSLDVEYPNANFMILGDYNDDVDVSVISPNPSSFQKMVEDTARYNAITLGISKAGAYSYLSSNGFLDHNIISNELTPYYIPNSVAVYDPRTDIANYVNTTSDHGPVIARFDFKKTDQTIDFPTITVSEAVTSYNLTATATSGLIVTYTSSDETIAKISNGTIQIIGAGTVTITASQSGNDYYSAAADATQTLTVTDTILPIIATLSSITKNNDSGVCGAVVNYTAPIGTDNFSGATTIQTAGLASGVEYPLGTTTNTFKVIDASGNTATSTFTVTVTDVELPSITTLANISKNNDTGKCGAIVTYTTPTGTDNCSGATTIQTAGLESGVEYPLGTTTNTFKVTDASGNTATSTFTVTVTDTELPSITTLANISKNNDTGKCGAIVTYAIPTGTDNCSGATTIQTAGLASGVEYPLGTTTNTFKVTDDSGNTATSTFTVTITDTELPSISTLVNISKNNDAGKCGAIVTYTIPTGTDNCSGATTVQISGLASGVEYPLGTTANTFKVTDASGNTATSTFNVTVSDTELPTISCSSNIITKNEGNLHGAAVTYTPTTGNDNCTGFTVTQTEGLASGSIFPLGVTTNTFKITDASGNSASCSFTVTVAEGTTLSVIIPKNSDANPKLSVVAHPNPSTDFVNITVKTDAPKNMILRLYNILGMLVGSPIEISSFSTENTVQINVSNFRKGVYVYTLSAENKVLFTDKIIKK
jgi:hypothetical protein